MRNYQLMQKYSAPWIGFRFSWWWLFTSPSLGRNTVYSGTCIPQLWCHSPKLLFICETDWMFSAL